MLKKRIYKTLQIELLLCLGFQFALASMNAKVNSAFQMVAFERSPAAERTSENISLHKT